MFQMVSEIDLFMINKSLEKDMAKYLTILWFS